MTEISQIARITVAVYLIKVEYNFVQQSNAFETIVYVLGVEVGKVRDRGKQHRTTSIRLGVKFLQEGELSWCFFSRQTHVGVPIMSQEVCCDMVREDVFQQLSVVMTKFPHILQFFLSLQFPEKI